MENHLDITNPLDIIGGLVLKGIILGFILFIAWPTKQLLDKGAQLLFLKAKELPRKRHCVQVRKELTQ